MLPNLERIDGCEKNVLTKSRNSSGKGPEEHLRSFVSSHTAPPLCMSESSFGVFCTCAIVVNLHVCDETHNAAVEIMFAVSSLRSRPHEQQWAVQWSQCDFACHRRLQKKMAVKQWIHFFEASQLLHNCSNVLLQICGISSKALQHKI